MKIRPNPIFPTGSLGELARELGILWRELSTAFTTSSLVIKDEGTDIDSDVTEIDFVGSGVSTTKTSTGKVEVAITGSGGTIIVKDEDTNVDTATGTINFTGSGVTATQTSSGVVEVAVGSSALTVEEEGSTVSSAVTTIDFVGAAITATSPSTGNVTLTADPDILMADTADILTAGFATTDYDAGTKSSGTFTPDEANGNLQYLVNGGAFTLAPPTNSGTMILLITNNGSAGTITTSAWTRITNAAPGLTNANKYLAYIAKINGVSHLTWVELQ